MDAQSNSTDNPLPPDQNDAGELSAVTDVPANISHGDAPNPPPPNDSVMEVHHHAHKTNGKKSWKSYFWEFLMLFLAVFCGFLAEYQLEHTIEREREKRYIVSMVKDLYMDTVNFSKMIHDGQETMAMIDSLIMHLHSANPEINSRSMYLMARKITHTITPYEITDRTNSALRTSGNLRLFRDQDVADKITSYYADIPTLQSQQNYIFNLLLQYIRDVNEVFEPAVFHNMYKAAGLSITDTTDASTFRYLLREPEGNVSIRNEPQAIRHLSSTLHYLYARILSTNSNVRNQSKGAAQLMDFLINTYDLEKELNAPDNP